MAGKDRTEAHRGARHIIKAVAFLLAFIPVALSGSLLHAGYVITGIDGTVTRTQSYYIENNLLHVFEGPEPLNVYRIRTVDAEDLSEDVRREKNASMQIFRNLVDDIQGAEKGITDAQTEILKEIEDLGVVGRTGKHIDSTRKKAFRKELASLKNRTALITKTLRQARLPDFSLLKARDIKLLQVLSLEASIDQTLRYLKNEDPTSIAYAEAQLRQAASFNESFQAALPWK